MKKVKSISGEIERVKKQLIKKAKKDGLSENFGDDETAKLMDKYEDYRYGSVEERNEFNKIIELFNWATCLDMNQLKYL